MTLPGWGDLDGHEKIGHLSESGFRNLILRALSEADIRLARIEATGVDVQAQVRLTNGRIRSLELWRAGLAGGLMVVSVIIVPLFLWVVKGG